MTVEMNAFASTVGSLYDLPLVDEVVVFMWTMMAHCESGLGTHVDKHGISSYFLCRWLSRDEMWNWSEYKFTHTTPKGVWNPYDSVCEDLESGFIDAEGRFDDEKLPEERKYHLIDDGEHVLSGLSDVQSSNADSTFAQQYQEEISRWFAAASVMLMEEDVIVMIEKWLHCIGR